MSRHKSPIASLVAQGGLQKGFLQGKPSRPGPPSALCHYYPPPTTLHFCFLLRPCLLFCPAVPLSLSVDSSLGFYLSQDLFSHLQGRRSYLFCPLLDPSCLQWYLTWDRMYSASTGGGGGHDTGGGWDGGRLCFPLFLSLPALSCLPS